MRRLPNAHLAMVDERKIVEYLLSTSHPAGRAKAAFFGSFGFRLSAWEDLRNRLLFHGRACDVVSSIETGFGTKYIVEGALIAPDGRRPFVRTVRFVAGSDEAPRLVTAYPVHGGVE